MQYLGTIDNAGSDVKNNQNTSSPFVIPAGTIALRLQPSAATQMAAMAIVADASFAPAAGVMLQLGAANSITDLPIALPQARNAAMTLAVRKTDAGAGTTKVFAIGAP
jgi:hypothetical protein